MTGIEILLMFMIQEPSGVVNVLASKHHYISNCSTWNLDGVHYEYTVKSFRQDLVQDWNHQHINAKKKAPSLSAQVALEVRL